MSKIIEEVSIQIKYALLNALCKLLIKHQASKKSMPLKRAYLNGFKDAQNAMLKVLEDDKWLPVTLKNSLQSLDE